MVVERSDGKLEVGELESFCLICLNSLTCLGDGAWAAVCRVSYRTYRETNSFIMKSLEFRALDWPNNELCMFEEGGGCGFRNGGIRNNDPIRTN